MKWAIDTLPPAYMASLHEELVGGRLSELEYWNGTVMRLGREAGVVIPLKEFIYHGQLPRDMKARGQE